MKPPLSKVITELQSFGLRVPADALQRCGGAGPAEAGSLVIDGFNINVPTSSPYVLRSPYLLRTRRNTRILFRRDTEIASVQMIPRPRFYDETTSDGIPCRKIALLHGKDCLATSVLQTCVHWHTNNRCRFCGIELSLSSGNTVASKTPEQLAYTARRAKELDGVRHMVLTTGAAASPDAEISTLVKSATAVKKATGLPLHAQFMPLSNRERLRDLKNAGVDTVGIHMESFHPETLQNVAPVKAAVGLYRYRKAWAEAVEIFGAGQVSSFILAGLGETPESIVQGSELLADLGVYPFIVPLRPIPGSRMAESFPPDAETMGSVYREAARILARKGITHTQSLAGCVRCGACSALPAHETPVLKIVCHPVRTNEERETALSIRHEVFVEEQRLFKETDLDENDDAAIHLVARLESRLVGTVRVYPARTGNGDWIGGRLAVRKGFRTSGAGERLVREAVNTVKKERCSRFTAHIQEGNVAFFKQLGWRTVGPVKDYFGRAHQLMEADLDHDDQLEERNEP